jgi:alpha-glucosidase
VAVQSGDPGSFLSLYLAALRLRREHPALGSGPEGGDSMRWLDGPDDALFFARDPGFLFAANLGPSAVPLPPHSAVLLASGPLGADEAGLATLPRDTAAWLAS